MELRAREVMSCSEIFNIISNLKSEIIVTQEITSIVSNSSFKEYVRIYLWKIEFKSLHKYSLYVLLVELNHNFNNNNIIYSNLLQWILQYSLRWAMVK